MKKTLLFIIFLLTFGLHAQDFWTEISPFTSNAYRPREISIVDQNVVWVSAGRADLNSFDQWARSEDGGITWTSGNLDFGDANLGTSNFYALSATTAYAAVFSNGTNLDGGVWITQDAGATWTKQDPSAFNDIDSFPNFVYFWNANDGIVVGDPVNGYFEIYTTNNSGTNWTRVPSGNIPQPLQSEYAYTKNYTTAGNTIWFGTSKGRIFKSDDNGLNWTVGETALTDFSGDAGGHYAFKNATEGILIARDFRLWKTTDGGMDWGSNIQNSITGTTRNFGIVNVPGTNNAYFSWGADEANIGRGSSYTLDGGQNWINLDDVDANPVTPELAKFKNGIIGFCIGSYLNDLTGDLKFFKLTDPLNRLNGTLTTTAFGKNDFKATPNPTHDKVRISGNNIISVAVCDLTGKTITTQRYFPSNEISFDMSSFQNGIYLLKINDNVGNSASKKIIKN